MIIQRWGHDINILNLDQKLHSDFTYRNTQKFPQNGGAGGGWGLRPSASSWGLGLEVVGEQLGLGVCGRRRGGRCKINGKRSVFR